MLLFPLTIVLGLSIGRLRGGRFRNLASVHLRRPGVVVAAVALQAGMGALDVGATARWLALVGSYALIGLWLAVNLTDRPTWFRVGIACLALGYGLNVAAIVPNGDMPVSAAALRRAGGSEGALHQAPNLDKHVTFEDPGGWSWLGDVVPVPALRVVVSIGDLALLGGVLTVLSGGMGARGTGSSQPRKGSHGRPAPTLAA
jgi:hypothetical protein